MENRQKIFYGYWILPAAAAGVFIFGGCGLYAFGLFIKPLEADLGWSRGAITLAHTLWLLSMGAASPLIGRLLDRWGARAVIASGAILTGLGFLALSRMESLFVFYLSYAVIGVGMAALGQVPGSVVVSHWFVRRRGLAIGVMSVAVGLGGFVITPVVGGFLIPAFGWRLSYFALALLVWILMLPPALFVIRTRPAEKGLYPDGMTREAFSALPRASAATACGISLKQAVATPAFWLIALCFLLHMFAQNGMVQTQIPHLSDLGFPTALVATVVGVVGMLSAFGKFGFGWLCDVLQAKQALAIGLGLQLAALGVMTTIDSHSSMAAVWWYTVLFGLGIGSWLPTMSLLVSSLFGLVSYGTIFGAVTLINNIGGALGPLLAGCIYDATGSYQAAIVIFFLLFAVSIPLILIVKKPIPSPDRQ
jgi:MFS family permease